MNTTKTYSDESGTAAGVQFWAYRYPTEDEVEAGRPADEMVELGAFGSEIEARRALPRSAGHPVGQIQINRDGEVYQYP